HGLSATAGLFVSRTVGSRRLVGTIVGQLLRAGLVATRAAVAAAAAMQREAVGLTVKAVGLAIASLIRLALLLGLPAARDERRQALALARLRLAAAARLRAT